MLIMALFRAVTAVLQKKISYAVLFLEFQFKGGGWGGGGGGAGVDVTDV